MTAQPVAVETGTVRGLADRLSGAAAALRSGSPTAGAAAAAGDPELAAALHRFDAAVGRARSELDDDLARLADTLRLVADAYDEVEREASGRFGPWRWPGR